MTWLVAHMWIVLAGAALIALILGWSVRGVLLKGRLRRAEVERDVTRTELGQAREEIEKLFEAQRKLTAAGPATAAADVPRPDAALQRELGEATAALEAARLEIEALKSAPAAAPLVAPVQAPPAVDEALVQRARDLEGRAAALEAELAEARRAVAAAEAARSEAATPAAPEHAARIGELEAKVAELETELAAARSAPAEAAAPVPDARTSWELGYLRQRVKALEGEVAAIPVAAAVMAAPALPETPAEAAPLRAEDDPVEEELARLRWRNRYLEGRLAYFEGDADSVAEEVAAEDAAAEEAAEAAEQSREDTAATAAEDAGSEAEAENIAEAGVDAGSEAADPAADIIPSRPLALDRPVEGAPDDLTLIGGIGPKIQEVLNTLGIYHYDQIADWTPENVVWVDEYLNFSGRISREGWVEQAAILVGEGAES